MTLNEKPAKSLLTPSRQFKFRGKQITITLIDPKVSPDGKELQINASVLWDFDGRYQDLYAPKEIHGWYVPATFKVEGFGFSMTMKIGFNNQKVKDASAIIVSEIIFDNPILPQQIEMVLPLERLKIYAIQLVGVFGKAYPPNYEEANADRSIIFGVDAKGGIVAETYGYEMTRSSAMKLIGATNRPVRDLNDPFLIKVAAAYEKYRAVSGHGIIAGIANDLAIGERQAKELVAHCRKPSIRLLPPTGRKRQSTKTESKKRGTK